MGLSYHDYQQLLNDFQFPDNSHKFPKFPSLPSHGKFQEIYHHSVKSILCVSVWSRGSEPVELPAHGGAFRRVQSSVLSHHGRRDADAWISEKWVKLVLFCDYIRFTGVFRSACSFLNAEFLFLPAKNQLEFCCHMLRGTIDPKEPPVYEYVKFIGNFKSLNNGESHTSCTRSVWTPSSTFLGLLNFSVAVFLSPSA